MASKKRVGCYSDDQGDSDSKRIKPGQSSTVQSDHCYREDHDAIINLSPGTAQITSLASEVCAQCATLDINDLLAPIPPQGIRERRFARHIVRLDTNFDSRSPANCASCCFFQKVRLGDGDRADPKASYSLYAIPAQDWLCDEKMKATVLCIAPTKDEQSNEDLRHLQERRGQFFALAQESKLYIPRSCVRARQINSSSIDINIIRGWLDSCKSSHGEKCQASHVDSKPWPKYLKLIDCENKTIIATEEMVPYVALSYVWGSSNVTQPAIPTAAGALPAQLPRTIQDAMTMVQHLGLRYIWIDRYCIEQVNNVHKDYQLEHMDLIYSHAFLTLIDAAGSNPDHGLPGVSTTTRKGQLYGHLKGSLLVSILSDPRKMIRSSEWMTRGWTYQESFFSGRRLVFTDEQVSWYCYGGTSCELVDYMLTGFFYDDPFRRQMPAEYGPYAIVSHLSSYVGRRLTYQTDAIRAFGGIFNHFRVMQHPVHHYLGIIIMPDFRFNVGNDKQRALQASTRRLGERFAAGLCWTLPPGTRRDCFPSWSWAGWSAESSFTSTIREFEFGLSKDKEAPVKVFLEQDDRSLYDFDEYSFTTLMKGSGPDDSPSRIIHIDAWTIPIKLEYMPPGAEQMSSRVSAATMSTHYGYFAIFEDAGERVEVALWSGVRIESTDEMLRKNSVRPECGEIVGIVLGPTEHVKLKDDVDRVFVLVAQCVGAFYARIGYIELMRVYMSTVASRALESWSIQKARSEFPWKTCFASKKRRTIRLG